MNIRNVLMLIQLGVIVGFLYVSSAQAQPFYRVWQNLPSGSVDETFNLFQAGSDFVVAGHAGDVTWSFLASLTRTGSDGSVIWSKKYSKARMGFCNKTADGGYIFTGPGFTTAGTNHLYLLRVDSLGEVLWYHYLDPGTTYLNGSNVVQMADGGFVLVSQAPDGLMIRTNAAGDIVFARYMTGLKFVSSAILVTSDGGYIVAGSAYQYGGASGYGIGLIKYNAANFVSWSRVIDVDSLDQFETVSCLSETPEHDLVLLSTLGYTIASIGLAHMVMTKLTAEGDLIWSKSHIAADTNRSLGAKSLLTNDPLRYVIAGAEYDRISSADSRDALWMCFTDSSGNPLFSRMYSDSIQKSLFSSSLIQTKTGYGFGFSNAGGAAAGGNDFGILHTDASGDLSCYSSPGNQLVNNLSPRVTNPTLNFSNASVSFSNLLCTGTDVFPVLFSSCSPASVSMAGSADQPSLQILPNPNPGRFLLRSHGLIDGGHNELSVYNLQGQIVFSDILEKPEVELKSDLPDGIYFVRLQSHEADVVQKLIIVR